VVKLKKSLKRKADGESEVPEKKVKKAKKKEGIK
jgi:hypothetical protein